MIINISDIWQDVVLQHAEFLNKVIDAGVALLGGSALERQVYQFIEDNREIIVSGSPTDLLSSIRSYNDNFKSHSLRSKAGSKLKKIFNYSDFSKKSDKPWTAYQLCIQARHQTCSYCHLVVIDSSLPNENGKGYRPPIDHYFAKADYPFLALSLSNFIPCCEKCNGSQMKGSVDFATKAHLNPLVDNESIGFALTVDTQQDAAEAITLNLPKDRYRLSLFIVDNEPASLESLKTFQLITRYQHYVGTAYHLAKKMRGVSARLNMHDEALDFETSIDDYLEFEPETYKSVPYGKARICIAKQFGAITD